MLAKLKKTIFMELDMKAFLRNLLALNFYDGSPLKYREASYTIAELEKRLTAETTPRRHK